jgi:hypothetical protein
MAGPIRWDNVNSRGNGDAIHGLNSAGNMFNNGFAQLGDVLKQSEAIQAGNWQNTRQNNTNAYLDEVAKYRTAEDLRGAQQSGVLDQLRQSFGYQIDADKVRNAGDTRAAALMDQAVKQVGYDNTMTDARQSGTRDQIMSMINSGDPKQIAQGQAMLQQVQLRNEAELQAAARDAGRQQTTWGQADKTFDLNQDRGRQEITASQAGIVNAQGMLGVARQNAGIQAQSVAQQGRSIDFNISTALADREAAMAAGRAASVRKGLEDSGNLYASGGVFSGKHAPQLLEQLTKAGIGDDAGERSAMIERANEMARKGITIKTPDGKQSMKITEIPLAAVQAALLGSNDQMINGWNQGYANSFEKNLTKILEQQNIVQGANGKPVLSNKMVSDLDDFRGAIRGATDAPVAIRPMNPQRPPQQKQKY